MDDDFFFKPHVVMAKNRNFPDKLGLNDMTDLLFSTNKESETEEDVIKKFNEGMSALTFISWVMEQLDRGLIFSEGETRNKVNGLMPHNERQEPLFSRGTIENLLVNAGMFPLDSDCLLSNWWGDEDTELTNSDSIASQILREDFGKSEYDVAFEIEAYINELKTKGNFDDEINRYRKILDRRPEHNATLIERHNAIAEIAALRAIIANKDLPLVSDLKKNLIPLPMNPCHGDRVKRFVWLDILENRKINIDSDSPIDAKEKELIILDKRIGEIKEQLGLDNEQIISNKIESKNKKDNPKRKTEINTFLFDLWIEKGCPNGKGLVYAIKPLVGRMNCPVLRYYGWHDEVCVTWKNNVGSITLSWGKKTFQNKVNMFKKQHIK